MSKKFLTVVAAVALVAMPISAKKATKEYQRPSLHMVLMNTDEPTSDLVADLMPTVSASWDNYEIPVLYNDWEIAFKEMNAGKPKGGIMELVTKYPDPSVFASMSIDQLKELKELLSGKQYAQDLRNRCDEQGNVIAHQLLAKWFNITPEGGCDMDSLIKYACYSATQAASNSAVEMGQSAFFEMFSQLSDPTIANTYVSFSKVAFYANEPIELFNKNLSLQIINMTINNAMAQMAAKAIAEKAYETTKEGYRAYTTTLLYKLKWNDSIKNALMDIMTLDPATLHGTIDYQKFQEMTFEMEYLGSDNCHTIVRLNKESKGMTKEDMVRLCIHKNLNKQIVNLQNQYEEFKPMVPILEVNSKYILADMGTKEGVEEGDAFDILSPVTDKKGITTYKWIGTVKVKKGAIWDNVEIDNTLVADDINNEGIVNGTKLAKFKSATTSMFVKEKKASKK